MSIDFSQATTDQILSAFDQHLQTSKIGHEERANAMVAAGAAIGLWCFLRDDEQFEPTAECLAHFARFSGPSNVAHHLRRLDIPVALIREARRVFMPEGNALAAAWDGGLHERLFARFVLGARG